jgi:LPXTG-motif cell wall-anchored protein
MRGQIPVGVILILALLLGLSSLGLNQPPHNELAQFTFPVTETPTNVGVPTDTPVATDTPTLPSPATDTPTSTSVIPPTFTLTGVPASPTSGQPPQQPTQRSSSPNPPGAPATPSLGIKVNNCARVVWPQGLSLNQGPGLSFGHVRQVALEDIVFITGGPERADGLWWWKARALDGAEGWGINDHLKPYKDGCFGLTAAATGTPIVIGATALPGQPAQTARPTSSATASSQQLPTTGSGNEWLMFAGGLVILVFVAGLIRRRAQSAG